VNDADRPRPAVSPSARRWSKSTLAVGGLVVLAFIWSYSWVISKVGLDYADPFTFTAYRASLSGGILLFLLVALRRPFKPKALAWTMLLGLLQTTGFAGLLIWALESGGAGKTSVLVYTMPFWLLLMAWVVLGERLVGLQWLAVVLGLIGLILILSPWHLEGVKSTVLAIAAGVSWAAGTVVAKIIHKRYVVDLLSLTAWQMAFGAIPLVLVATLVSSRPTEWSGPFIIALGYNVIFAGCIAWIIWLFVLRVLPAGKTGLSSLAVPVLAVLMAWLQLHEQPPLGEAVGMGLIVLGLAVQAFREMVWQGPRARARARRSADSPVRSPDDNAAAFDDMPEPPAD